ncbi:MAG: hypothetical protein ACPGQL_06955 [Thermoplasmatota archaeon]
MGRSRVPASGKKKSISITPDPKFLAWVEERSGPGKQFATITHAIEFAIAQLIEAEEHREAVEAEVRARMTQA